MRLFHLTSAAFTGFIEFEFNESGLLSRFDTSKATLAPEQQVFLLRRLPRHLDEIKKVFETSETAKFTEIKQEITFDMFWNRYDDKLNSSRKRSLQRWDKMSTTDQVRAYRYIGTYFNNMPNGTRKKYAETYLNAELWNN